MLLNYNLPMSDGLTEGLAHKVRYAIHENSPEIIKSWLQATSPSQVESIQACRRIYRYQFKLLMETICDDIIPGHWRRTCLDNIYKPLHGFQRVALCPHSRHILKLMYAELNQSIKYFGKSMLSS